MMVIPINLAEAIIEPFFNGGTSDQHEVRNTFVIDHYDLEWQSDAVGKVTQMWDGVYAFVQGGATGKPCLTMRRTCSLDVSGYDTFIAFAGLPDWVSIAIDITVDGEQQRVVAPQSGGAKSMELEGFFTGTELSEISATFVLDRVPENTGFHLKWFGLSNSLAKKTMLAKKSGYTDEWPGLIESEPETATAEIGIYFGGEELTNIRKMIKTEPFRTVFAGIRDEAQQDLSIVPEKYIGETNPGGTDRYIRVRDREAPDLCQPAIRLAFVGLVESNPKMSRLAARMALSLTFCQTWDESTIGHLSGSIWHHRSFSQERAIKATSLVLDWAGSYLTTEAKRVIRDAIIMKGLPRLENDFRTIEYIRSMNQGIVFNAARIIGLLALLPVYPRYKARLIEAEKDLHEMIENYVKKDGGTLEGCGYWNYTFSNALPQCFLLARHRGTTLSEYATDTLRKTGDFPLSMLSVSGDGTSYLPINDAHSGRFAPMVAAAYTQISKQPAWKTYYARCLTPNRVQPNFEHLVMHPKDFDIAANKGSVTQSKFSVLAKTGHVDSVRVREGRDPIHFHYITGPVEAGHYHDDKGSFILEAGDEALLIDRGICDYGHPFTVMLKMARFHNVLTPDNPGGLPIEQPNDVPGGHLTAAKTQDGVFWIAADNTRAWEPGIFERSVRRVVSPAGGLYVFDDEVSLTKGRSVTFNLHTKLAAAIENDAAIIRGTAWRVRIVPLNWQPTDATAKIDGIDEHLEDVTAIRFTSEVETKHRLFTAIEVYPELGDYEWAYTVTGHHIGVKRSDEILELDSTIDNALSFVWNKASKTIRQTM